MLVLEEVDNLKIYELSYKKLLVEHDISISIGTDIVDTNKYKIIYKINEAPLARHTLVSSVDEISRKISKKYGVKMRNIHFDFKTECYIGRCFRLIDKIIIKDNVWIRNYRIAKIFNNESSSD